MARTLLLSLLLLVLSASAYAQVDSIPDLYGDQSSGHLGYRQNEGQVRDSHGYARPDIKFTSEAANPHIALRENSTISLYMASIDSTQQTEDTLYRIDMTVTGELSNNVDPEPYEQKPGHANYYLGHCPQGITGVPAYGRVVYPGI